MAALSQDPSLTMARRPGISDIDVHNIVHNSVCNSVCKCVIHLGIDIKPCLQLPQTLIYPRPNLLLRNKVHCTFIKPFWQYASPHTIYNLVYCCNTLGVYGGAFSLLSVWNMVASVESTLQLHNRWSELKCAVSKLTENWPGLIVQGSSSSSVWLGWLQGLWRACVSTLWYPTQFWCRCHKMHVEVRSLFFVFIRKFLSVGWAVPCTGPDMTGWHLWIFNATHKEKNMHNHGVSYNYLDMAFSTIISSWLPYSRKME